MRALYADLWDDGAVVASSEAVGFAGSNSQVAHIIKKWRTTADTDENIVMDAGAAVTADTVAIVGHNFASGATINIQANATDSWGAPSFDETLTWRDGILLHYFASSQAFRFWRVRIQDAANPDGYVELGRVLLGLRLAITDGGHSAVAEIPSQQVHEDRVSYALSNELYGDVGVKRRGYTFEFRNTPETLKSSVELMYDTVSRHSPLVLTVFDDAAEWGIIEPIYCALANDFQPTWLGNSRWSFGIQIREVA